MPQLIKNFINSFWCGYRNKRTWRFLKQKVCRGYSAKELWCLFHTIAVFILPRLKLFRKDMVSGHPPDLSQEQWKEYIDKMINAFELIVQDDMLINHKKRKAIDTGLRLFQKYFFSLWC